MPRYQVSMKITSTKRVGVWAKDDEEAEEKATAIVLDWAGVDDAEALDVEEEQ